MVRKRHSDEDGISNKARRWRGRLDAVADGSLEDVELHLLSGKPQDLTLFPAFETAKEI